MKKSIFAIIAAFAAATCFGACNSSCDSETVNEYDNLNSMLKHTYSKVDLTVTENFGNDSLTSKFEMLYSGDEITVIYTLERFAEISIDNPATDVKETLNGEMKIKNGEVISGGIVADVAIPDGISFKEEYFENAVLTGMTFNADVKNANGFLGTEITCTDMKVEALFPRYFKYIEINFTSAEGNPVEYIYNFTA